MWQDTNILFLFVLVGRFISTCTYVLLSSLETEHILFTHPTLLNRDVNTIKQVQGEIYCTFPVLTENRKSYCSRKSANSTFFPPEIPLLKIKKWERLLLIGCGTIYLVVKVPTFRCEILIWHCSGNTMCIHSNGHFRLNDDIFKQEY